MAFNRFMIKFEGRLIAFFKRPLNKISFYLRTGLAFIGCTGRLVG